MLDILELIEERAHKDSLFEVYNTDTDDPRELHIADIDLEDSSCITMIDGTGKVYGVSSPEVRGSTRPTAVCSSEHGEAFVWIFDKPVPEEMLKGTGLSPDLFVSEVTEFSGLCADAQDLIFPDKFIMGFGKGSSTQPGKWKSITSSKSEFVSFLNQHKVGKKDGTCFTQGELLDGKRTSRSVVQNFIMVFDIDVGMTEKDITDKLSKYGYEYLLYSTHSHLKDTTSVRRDAFFKWSKEDSSKSVKVSSMKSYLTDFKKYLPEVVEGMSIKKDAEPSSNGVMTVISHNPIPKFRIVFFLNTPFIFQGKFNQEEKTKEWKDRYYGLSLLLDLPIDKSCMDPSRLFYFGRHEEGQEHSVLYAHGAPLVLENVERADFRDKGKDSSDVFSKAASEMGGDEHSVVEFEDTNLKEWAVSYAEAFNIQDALEDTGYDEFRDERSHKDGVHIQCPFEDGHTEIGGNGTYILNASDNEEDSGFLVHCMHDSCSGRDRLDFLKGLLEEGHLSLEDITNSDYLCEEEIEIVEEAKEGKAEKKTNKKVKKFSEDWFVAKISEMTKRSDNHYNIVKHLVAAEDVPEGIANDMLKDISTASNVPLKKIKSYAEKCESKQRAKEERNRVTVKGFYDLKEVKEIVHDLNEYLYFANSACKVLRKTHDINGSIKYEAKSVYDMGQLFSNYGHSIAYKGEDKECTSFDLWMKSPDRNTCEGLTYQPRKPERIYRAEGNTVFLNTYSEFVKWDDEDPECSWDLMQAHILNILCKGDEDLYNRFILFFANIVQNPDKKYAQTLIIKGDIGCGKSIVMDYIREMMGRSAMEMNDSNSITGKFNEHLAEKLLVVLDEGDFKKSMNKLKNIISSKTLEIEPKGMAKIWVNNCIRIVVTTNSEDTVEVSLGSERRFFILACSNKWVQSASSHQKRKDDKVRYFNAIQKQMEEEGGVDQMFYDLKNWNPDDYGLSFSSDLMMAPMTEGLREESATSANRDESFVSSFIQNGFLREVPNKDLDEISLFPDEDNEMTIVPRKLIQEHFYEHMERTRSKMRQTPNEVSKLLRRVAGVSAVRNGKVNYPNMAKSEKATTHCYAFPPRREMFDHMISKGFVEKGIDIDD